MVYCDPKSVWIIRSPVAVLYVLKTGCQWRQVPGDFPEWRSVYNYYKIWSTKAEPTADSLLEQVLKKLSLLGELTKDVQL
ncbi:transposase [Lacticaseibacillus rhamnosus]|nr:transposase [Lacticaseibacillus paracasei]TLQ21703.1 transposase [Lacticaseibacillus rhamnosus]